MPEINVIHLTLEIWGIIFCVIETVCVISGFETSKKKSALVLRMIIANMLLLLCDSLAWCFRGVPDTLGRVMTRIGNFGTFVQSDVMIFLFAEYLENLFGMEKGKKKIISAVKIIALTGIVLTVVSQFTNLLYYFDDNNVYHRAKFYFLNIIIAVIGLGGCGCVIAAKRKQLGPVRFITTSLFLLMTMFSAILLAFRYGIAFGNIAATISVMYIFTVNMFERSVQLQKQQEEILRQKLEIEESKTALLAEIIKPHFINNSLSLIINLCYENPEKAAETLSRLSKFLHTGMFAMENRTMISLDEEMELLDNYLYIEQQRFPDIITVHKNINTGDFLLPPLTIQPVVENAVRHGIRQRNKAGNIYIFPAMKRKMNIS